MSDTLDSLRRQLDGAAKLHGIVSSMKALAASNVTQFERASAAVTDYSRVIELGLIAAFRTDHPVDNRINLRDEGPARMIVIGSDQGLVGHFNEQIADFAIESCNQLGCATQVIAVGERVIPYLTDAKLCITRQFATPNSVTAIVPLIGDIIADMNEVQTTERFCKYYLVYTRPESRSSFKPVVERLLPLDQGWYQSVSRQAWPTRNLPELLNSLEQTLPALIREYLFISLFKACADSLTSENASRLAAMRRADKNIDETLNELGLSFHQLRQTSIDAELFDLVSGFQAVAAERS